MEWGDLTHSAPEEEPAFAKNCGGCQGDPGKGWEMNQERSAVEVEHPEYLAEEWKVSPREPGSH